MRFEDLVSRCADGAFDDGVRIDSVLEPLGGPGASVKPAVYEGGVYQQDRRWADPAGDNPEPVIVIDNVPSQANRLEEAIRSQRSVIGVPEMVLDLSDLDLPSHLPREVSSWHFPHRVADAYLRDSQIDGVDFLKTNIGRDVFAATPWSAGALVAWFPGAVLYGFWQSHLGKKRANTKHARAWVSEILGWSPATGDTRVKGLKGDPLNLNTDEVVTSNPDNRVDWEIGKVGKEGAKADKLSEMGHGQVPFMRDSDAPAAAVSFARLTQRATVSFAQLRRVSLGDGYSAEADAAARALLVALGLHAHVLAFGRGFALRSGAELRVLSSRAVWLGAAGDEERDLGDAETTGALLRSAREHAASAGVPLDGWGQEPLRLTPKDNLRKAIKATWSSMPENDAGL
ncbi:MAG: type I-U CRISPR-associated RAMP protein Csb1/Cas7u [Actinomycetia bacterium]|nr:type I-U CRISPR-associated RAMP protein Csb1/Cas7u [Actinomycetes bacterium]